MTISTKSKNGAAPPAASGLLATVRTGKRPAPDRVIVIGTEGVGKSTWAAGAPSPIFLAVEDGIRNLDVASFPEPESFAGAIEQLRALATEEHAYRTLVVDTVDWLEPLIHRSCCARNNWDSIEAPGYGKGYVECLAEWTEFLKACDWLRKNKGMEIILLAHSTIKRFSNPAGEDYDRYESKLNKQAAALLKEWADAVLFACYEERAVEKKGRIKGRSTGRRIVHTVRTAAWDAKNRYGLPETLPLDYAEYAEARAAHAPATVADMEKEALELLAQFAGPKAKAKEIRKYIDGAKGDAEKMAVAVNRLRSLVDDSPVAENAAAEKKEEVSDVA